MAGTNTHSTKQMIFQASIGHIPAQTITERRQAPTQANAVQGQL